MSSKKKRLGAVLKCGTLFFMRNTCRSQISKIIEHESTRAIRGIDTAENALRNTHSIKSNWQNHWPVLPVDALPLIPAKVGSHEPFRRHRSKLVACQRRDCQHGRQPQGRRGCECLHVLPSRVGNARRRRSAGRREAYRGDRTPCISVIVWPSSDVIVSLIVF